MGGPPGVKRAGDLFDRAALGLDSKKCEDETGLAVPKGEEEEGREDRLERHLGTDVVGRADDKREAERADDLAEIADAVAEPHAAGAQPVWPNLREVRPDDRVAGIAKEALDHDQ